VPSYRPVERDNRQIAGDRHTPGNDDNRQAGGEKVRRYCTNGILAKGALVPARVEKSIFGEAADQCSRVTCVKIACEDMGEIARVSRQLRRH
jgi:hypothetical protein